MIFEKAQVLELISWLKNHKNFTAECKDILLNLSLGAIEQLLKQVDIGDSTIVDLQKMLEDTQLKLESTTIFKDDASQRYESLVKEYHKVVLELNSKKTEG